MKERGPRREKKKGRGRRGKKAAAAARSAASREREDCRETHRALHLSSEAVAIVAVLPLLLLRNGRLLLLRGLGSEGRLVALSSSLSSMASRIADLPLRRRLLPLHLCAHTSADGPLRCQEYHCIAWVGLRDLHVAVPTGLVASDKLSLFFRSFVCGGCERQGSSIDAWYENMSCRDCVYAVEKRGRTDGIMYFSRNPGMRRRMQTQCAVAARRRSARRVCAGWVFR